MAEDQELKKAVGNCFKEYLDFPSKGVLFRDIHPLMENAPVRKSYLDFLVNRYKGKADIVVGLECRGFYFGIPLAFELGLPFVPLRKAGKLPGEVVSVSYGKEYGKDEIQVQKAALPHGKRVVILDDLLATGGTAAAACELVKKCGVIVVEFHCTVELKAMGGRKRLPPDVPFYSFLEF